MLIKYSEKINKKNRIKGSISWLNDNNTYIKYGKEMLTHETFYKQIALYPAAKDRMNEFEDVVGISVKCFIELSDTYGADPCFLPSFLPFFEDSEGVKTPMLCVCEGDIKSTYLFKHAFIYFRRGIFAVWRYFVFKQRLSRNG